MCCHKICFEVFLRVMASVLFCIFVLDLLLLACATENQKTFFLNKNHCNIQTTFWIIFEFCKLRGINEIMAIEFHALHLARSSFWFIIWLRSLTSFIWILHSSFKNHEIWIIFVKHPLNLSIRPDIVLNLKILI